MAKTKQSIYLSDKQADELREEAKRIDRSLSWVMQRAWKISRSKIKEIKQ